MWLPIYGHYLGQTGHHEFIMCDLLTGISQCEIIAIVYGFEL